MEVKYTVDFCKGIYSNVAIWCPTFDEYVSVCKIAGQGSPNGDLWGCGKDQTCLTLSGNGHIGISLKEIFEINKYTIVPACVFIADNQPASITDVTALASNTVDVPKFEWNDSAVIDFAIKIRDLEYKCSWDEAIEQFKASKTRVPIVTTEDGVLVYHADLITVVNQFFGIQPMYAISKEAMERNDEKTKYFSTREAAEDWVRYNKPCLSIAAILFVFDNIFKGRGIVYREDFEEEIKKIVTI